MPDLTKEQQILMTMRKTLAAVVRDVTPPPGLQHPLSAATIEDVKACLALIAARERELADEQGRTAERPYYADQVQPATLVPISQIGKNRQRE